MANQNGPSLGACLAMDAVGCASYFLPGLGETLDIIWALIAGAVFHSWFKSTAGTIGSAIEELIPFTDFVPSFTIGYFILNNQNESSSSSYSGGNGGNTKVHLLDGYSWTGSYDSNGYPNGKGQFTFPDGEVYIGYVLHGERSGHGRAERANGEVYEGEWKDDLPNGFGSHFFSDGWVFQGEYVNGVCQGPGKFIAPNKKEMYIGQWKNDEPDSNSKFTYIDENGQSHKCSYDGVNFQIEPLDHVQLSVNVHPDYSYSEDDLWFCLKGGIAYIGITDYAQHELGDIVVVSIPPVSKLLEKGDVFGSVEAVKTVADLTMPVSGRILEFNPLVVEDASLLNTDPYGKGWIIKIKPSNLDEVMNLMNATEYTKKHNSTT